MPVERNEYGDPRNEHVLLDLVFREGHFVEVSLWAMTAAPPVW